MKQILAVCVLLLMLGVAVAQEGAPSNAAMHIDFKPEFFTNKISFDIAQEKLFEEEKAKAEKGDAIFQYKLGCDYYSGKGVATNYSAAVKWYLKSAEQNYSEAQYNLGVCYFNGTGIAIDEVEAVKWYRKAAEQNLAQAQYNLGGCYINGTGIAKDEVEAVKWYRKAAEQNLAQAQNGLGSCYANGIGIAKNEDEAVKWYLKSAQQDFPKAQFNLGLCYFNAQGVAKDIGEALKWLRKAAEQNDIQAQLCVAVMHFNGLGVTTNRAEALKWLRMATEQNSPQGEWLLGLAYENGQGVETNLTKAAELYRKAAEQGFADAQFNLGLLLFSAKTLAAQRGDGSLTLNLAEAEKWYLKAAEQGHIDAQTQLGLIKLFFKKNYADAAKWLRKAADKEDAGAEYLLGTMHLNGWGMEKDYLEAVKWIQKSAEHGHEEGQIDIGAMYFEGQGVEKDFAEAYAWWNLAAKSSTNAVHNRAILEKRMTPGQIAEAQKRTKELRVLVESHSRKEQSQADPFSIAQARKSAPTASGTGFFITDDGYLISNYHVVKGAAKVRLVTSAGFIDTTVVKVDAANDLALLKAAGKFTPLPIAASRTIKLGATVATVGFPSTGLQGFSPKLAKGEIASLAGASDDPRYFQISVPVQPGNSGGALVDARGNVVGIVSAKLSAKAALDATGQLPENVNYAVKSSLLLSFLESVPDVASKLKDPNTKDEPFEDVVKSAQDAAVLVLVY